MKKRFKNYFIALLALFATYFGYANNDEQVIVFVDPTQLVFIESKVDTSLDFSKNIYTEESEVFIKENTVLVEKEDSFENAILVYENSLKTDKKYIHQPELSLDIPSCNPKVESENYSKVSFEQCPYSPIIFLTKFYSAICTVNQYNTFYKTTVFAVNSGYNFYLNGGTKNHTDKLFSIFNSIALQNYCNFSLFCRPPTV